MTENTQKTEGFKALPPHIQASYVSAEWMEEVEKRDHRASQALNELPLEVEKNMSVKDMMKFLRPYYEVGVDEPVVQED